MRQSFEKLGKMRSARALQMHITFLFIKIIQNTQLFVKDTRRAIKKCLGHFRVHQIFKAENLNLNLKIKKKTNKVQFNPNFFFAQKVAL